MEPLAAARIHVALWPAQAAFLHGRFFSHGDNHSFSNLPTYAINIFHLQIEARRKKKLVIEDNASFEENDSGSASINAGDRECSIIDDELEEELKKLGDLEPLERQLIRLEGLEPYVLVSVLTATASYSTITSEEFIVDGVIDWTGAGLLASALGSTLCGLYSTIIFSLSILYGKTALGELNSNCFLAYTVKRSLMHIPWNRARCLTPKIIV